LYRTGISVGDYPIDHHHKKNEAAPQHLEFFPVPSYNIPLGALIPEKFEGLIVAEKGISVSNVVNGTTRLQPVVMLTGQAAGVLSDLSVIQKTLPRNVPVRMVQSKLLNAGANIMPYIDASSELPHFSAIQKIGATGILKGTGIPFKWANQTWFYPDSTIYTKTFLKDINEYQKINIDIKNEFISVKNLFNIINKLATKKISETNFKNAWTKAGLIDFETKRAAKRYEIAVMLDKLIDPFKTKQINYSGKF
ncbi:MAG: FAD-dependent oxidoreductase, partial [Ferruginibacter sp.]|nr:FAD-dependent oxidoreductase [Ferruginibacter sp.]